MSQNKNVGLRVAWPLGSHASHQPHVLFAECVPLSVYLRYFSISACLALSLVT